MDRNRAAFLLPEQKLLLWAFWLIFITFTISSSHGPITVAKSQSLQQDQYAQALHKALLFFNAQKSGRLPKDNGVPWRGNSGLKDGWFLPDGLVGGYYDAGDNTKYHFPMAYSMTLLSWSVVEYGHKYKALGEYDHIRDIIKWGTDYLLLTFNSSLQTNDIYTQVGGSRINTNTPDDHFCWERPEDMDYYRSVQITNSAPDLGAEVAAALAAASIVFRDNVAYSTKLIKGAVAVYKFARDFDRRTPYSRNNPSIEPFYNSTGYWDEYIWSATWMYFATGNGSYISLATNPTLAKNAKAFTQVPDLAVFSWDNKLPGADLLLTRYKMFLDPGYPEEETLKRYQTATIINFCSYQERFNVFNWTQGGLIQLNHGRPRPLQYAVNAAFLASLYADYMTATKLSGWYCGPFFFSVKTLRNFASSQVKYVLGANPYNMSYVVGYGQKYPTHVHHRGASIPRNVKKQSCTGGWKWRDSKSPNPNTINGAMVAGPDGFEDFSDVRANYRYTEPTMAGNAGLVAALISLTASGKAGVDKNTMFSAVPPLFPMNPPPPPPLRKP